MLITCAIVKNYKRARDVEIRPEADRHLLLIAGDNTHGKTSIMDAIDTVIGGKRTIAKDPVHHGEAEAFISLTWDNGMTATRTIDADGSTKIEVKGKDGKVAAPQALFDQLIGSRMLDPLAFSRLAPADQREKLLEIIDKDKQLVAIDAQRERIFTTRTEIGRKRDDADGELNRLPPEVEVGKMTDVGALAAEQAELVKMLRAADAITVSASEAEAERMLAEDRVRDAARDCESIQAEIARLTAKLTERQTAGKLLLEDLTTCREVEAGKLAKVAAARAEWEKVAPRRAEIEADLANANAHNRAIVEAEQSNARRIAAQKVLDQRVADYATGTAELAKIDAKKLAFLAAAKLPVQGLGIEAGGITLNGIPLANASGAEKLRVALGIAIAAQSEIKDIMIRDASLLDDPSMAIVNELATAGGCRVWLERVGTRDPGALIIRDGKIAES